MGDYLLLISHSDLARYCQRIYDAPNPDVLRTALHPNDVSAFFWEPSSDELVIAGPGTHDVDQWFRDFTAIPLEVSRLGLLEAGFAGGALALWPQVRDKIDASSAPLVTFTGHSLWAATAQVMAALHSRDRPSRPFRCVAHASPRVAFLGNYWFTDLMERVAAPSPIYARYGDPVPEVPTMPPYAHRIDLTMLGKPDTPESTSNHNIALYVSDEDALGV